MAITTVQQAIAEINATNLTDGQQIKQLLADLSTFLASGSAVPAATTAVAGVVKQGAATGALSSVGPGTVATGLVDVTATPTQTTINANFATLGTLLDNLISSLTNAGVLA